MLLAIVFVFQVTENVYAENWVKCDDGVYYDADYYHIDPIYELEYWRIKLLFSDGTQQVQRWEYNMRTQQYNQK